MRKGLIGGVIGRITIVSYCEEEGKAVSDFLSGHAFLVYESYIKDSFDASFFESKFIYDASAENFIQHNDTESYPYDMDIGSHFTIGNFPTAGGADLAFAPGKDNGGIMLNAEVVSIRNKPEYGENMAAYSRNITEDQLKSVFNYCEDNNYYNLYYHNCATVASNCWKDAFGDFDNFEAKADSIKDGLYSVAYTPTVLRENILNRDGSISSYHAEFAEIANSWK